MLCCAEQLQSSSGSDMKPVIQSFNSGLMRDVANDTNEVMNAQTLVVITKAQSVDKRNVQLRAKKAVSKIHQSIRQGDWSRRRSRLHPSPGLRI